MKYEITKDQEESKGLLQLYTPLIESQESVIWYSWQKKPQTEFWNEIWT